jgi:hypothetical protein
MTTQEVYNDAMDLIISHGLKHADINVHNHYTKCLGDCWSITILHNNIATTQSHPSPFKALFELNTLLTDLKAKSCIQDSPNP